MKRSLEKSHSNLSRRGFLTASAGAGGAILLGPAWLNAAGWAVDAVDPRVADIVSTKYFLSPLPPVESSWQQHAPSLLLKLPQDLTSVRLPVRQRVGDARHKAPAQLALLRLACLR